MSKKFELFFVFIMKIIGLFFLDRRVDQLLSQQKKSGKKTEQQSLRQLSLVEFFAEHVQIDRGQSKK